jgi:hypothetical protein
VGTRPHVRLFAVGFAALALFGAAAAAHVGHATPPTTVDNRIVAVGNHVVARHAADKMLGLAVLPPGARRLARAPGAPRRSLNKPWLRTPFTPYTPYAGRHEFWHVDRTVPSVFRFLEVHRPPGSQLVSEDPPRGLLFYLPPTRRLYERLLSVTIAAFPDGSSAVRIDAFAVWNVERSAEALPAGIREIGFESIDYSKHAYHTRNPTQVATIFRWFNALPIAQPGSGVPVNCPMISGPRIRIAFKGAGRTVLARASVDYDGGNSYWCNPIQFSIGRQREKSLIGGHFLRRVGGLLHVRFHRG